MSTSETDGGRGHLADTSDPGAIASDPRRSGSLPDEATRRRRVTPDAAPRHRVRSEEATLVLAPNIDDGDGFYDELLGAHAGLDEAASHALNARLVLVLCNHVGDRDVLREALRVARGAAS